MRKIKLAIIGSGPAGYSAAIYASRALLKPVLFTGQEIGGQLMYTTEVENYAGFSKGIQGVKLMQEMQQQAQNFGTEIVGDIVTAVDFSSQPFKIWHGLKNQEDQEKFKQAKGEDYLSLAKEIKKEPALLQAEAVIVATGAASIMLGLPNEKKLLGRGVSVCAVCDAAFFKDKKVFVIGGGDSAMEDALALANFTDQVTIIHRRDKFRASQIMQDRVLKNPHIKVLWNSEVTKINGENKLESILVSNDQGGQELAADGLFLAIGHRPASKIFQEQLELDKKGFVITSMSNTDQGLKLAKKRLNKSGLVKLPSMTAVEGVFAAGDVVDMIHQQAITAAGTGAAAALDVELWLGMQNN